MNVIDNSPGVMIMNAEEVMDSELLEEELRLEIEREIDETRIQTSLSSHISTVFQGNKDARTSSEIETKMLQSLRAYNGHYDPEDIARIKQSGGTDIYMNITPTKCRAAMSWIRDILMPAKEEAWSLEPTPLPQIPQEQSDAIKAQISKYIEEQPTPEGQSGSPVDTAQKLKDTNQIQRDVEEAIQDEIYRLAASEVSEFATTIADELAEGGWNQALSDFIEDFCVFQVAIMKAPVITKRKGLTWKNGQPVPIDDYVYLNKRVSPLDIYPSANATCINDGNLCEHIRLQRKELYNLIGVKGYKEEYIRQLLENTTQADTGSYVDSYIESEKTVEEYRGDTYRSSKGVYHGVHYHGSASYTQLKEWGYPITELGDDTDKEFEIEAIMVGDVVIKCKINDDPLLRRPYYKASFQNVPGSWWGRSLPELMRDIQRMCNATARALANNMGISSGPQVEVNIDRLAADEEIEEMYPWKTWQTTNDPTGSGGKAISFFQPNSNAGELLKVYSEFEARADDATGIPRYAHGNNQGTGAAQTSSGLAMLLESASKSIKDAVRHIDDGLIKPRIEYQFYWDMLTNPELKFTGDIKVIAKGSQALTMRAAQEMRRNEFLQILQAPIFGEIIGSEGLAEILREMSKSLGLGDNIVPSRVELRFKQKQKEESQAQAQQQAMQMEQDRQATGVKQVEMQVTQAEQASLRKNQLDTQIAQLKAQADEQNRQIKIMELELREREMQVRNTTEITKTNITAAQKDNSDNKNIALSIQSGYQDKSNIE